MAQEYTHEPQAVRSNCLQWRRQTIQLIKEEKWDMLEINPCLFDDCAICQNSVMRLDLLEPLFLIPTFTLEIQRAIERMYGPQSRDHWYRMLLEQVPSLSTLRYFIENGLIDIHCGKYAYTIFNIFSQYYRSENVFDLWEYLLSDGVGYNINLQDSQGNNILLSLLLRLDYYADDEHNLLSTQKITYLLQKGADPLLENKDGVSAWSHVCHSARCPQETKNRFIQLLEKYI